MKKTNCREAAARLYEYLDGELTPESAEAIREHLELCQSCYPHLCFARAFQETLRRADHLRAKLAELLRAEGLDPDA